MPHLSCYLTPDVVVDNQDDLLRQLHCALDKTQVFTLADIKSRLFVADAHRVGDGVSPYVYVKLALMAGRDDDTKKQLMDALLDALQASLAGRNPALEYCVEVVELSQSYGKIKLKPNQT